MLSWICSIWRHWTKYVNSDDDDDDDDDANISEKLADLPSEIKNYPKCWHFGGIEERYEESSQFEHSRFGAITKKAVTILLKCGSSEMWCKLKWHLTQVTSLLVGQIINYARA